MNEPVNLLGDLDRAIAGMEAPVRERRWHRDRLIDVRAAVAELVEANRNCMPRIMHDDRQQEVVCMDPANWDRICTALARFGGAK